MGRCKPMYGFDEKETECLRRRFYKLQKEEAEWEDVYDFMMWARDSGFEKNLHMGKRDKTLPHGPENSFWLEKGYASERYLKEIRQNCDFCTGCEKRCSVSGLGCKDWRNYFVKKLERKNICSACEAGSGGRPDGVAVRASGSGEGGDCV